ncbi:hypothetical protein [Vulcaniibacterium tengchongense]|uniref:Uncharacterized protein n=1 Tax=Vulcaniibacterium tengchongense TaxID=1273429 RepID=A0A3N4VGH2_9GAMM|nr:hypothetical protein [Vulcaniibacterium tengchongense]RPE81828.1 hypothetical protein EDC50_1030 [Vulcaniibacterium tengchongense]
MLGTCPHCAFQAEMEAFFTDDEGKRLAAAVAELPPECGRAVLAYLRLFKPPKTGLRMARAVKLAREVADLIAAGTVCKDERTGMRRPVAPAMWAQGIEQMLAQRDRLSLPLEGHGYLRAVVFSLADAADAAAERRREADARAGRHLSAAPPLQAPPEDPRQKKLQNELDWIRQQLAYGLMEPEEAEKQCAAARVKYGTET